MRQISWYIAIIWMLRGFCIGIAIAPASAQQQPDPIILQHVIPSLQAQRNEAQDKAALAEARAAQLAEEVQKLKAELEKMKAGPTDNPLPPRSP